MFEGIPAIGPLGEEFKYTVREETEVLGYTSEVTGDDTNGFVIKKFLSTRGISNKNRQNLARGRILQ